MRALNTAAILLISMSMSLLWACTKSGEDDDDDDGADGGSTSGQGTTSSKGGSTGRTGTTGTKASNVSTAVAVNCIGGVNPQEGYLCPVDGVCNQNSSCFCVCSSSGNCTVSCGTQNQGFGGQPATNTNRFGQGGQNQFTNFTRPGQGGQGQFTSSTGPGQGGQGQFTNFTIPEQGGQTQFTRNTSRPGRGGNTGTTNPVDTTPEGGASPATTATTTQSVICLPNNTFGGEACSGSGQCPGSPCFCVDNVIVTSSSCPVKGATTTPPVTATAGAPSAQ